HLGVVLGSITLVGWLEICSPPPGRILGRHPRRGANAPGADADVVVYDPQARQVISAATHHLNVDYSAYEGMEITGKVDTVLSRGRVVVDSTGFRGAAGHGRFLSRELNQYLV
ncbi:dihydropyrimidinase, partial [Actinosynnema sp. NPDC023658]